MKYNICVPLKIKTDNLYQNQQIFKKVIEAGPDFIEFRFDYIKNINNLTELFLKQLIKNCVTQIPIILTLRHHNEGGAIQLSDNDRLEILRRLINSHPHFLDIEINSNIETLNSIVESAYKERVPLIFSYHNFISTNPFNNIVKKINNFEIKINNNHPEKKGFLANCIYKLIFSANSFEDNLVPLEICKYFSKNNKRIISFCMGETGIFSRIMCVKFGSYLTYGFYNEKTASGQINIEIIRKFHQLLFQ